MSFEAIGDSFKDHVDQVEEHYSFVVASQRIWMFSKQHRDQKTFNWGHRITMAGGYAIAFNTVERIWEEKKEFGPLVEEENSSEVLFDLNGSVHLLVTSAFGEVSFNKIFKWSGEEWEEAALEAPDTIVGLGGTSRVTITLADTSLANERYIVMTMESTMRLYRLTGDEASVTVEHVADVPETNRNMRGIATSAVKLGDRVLISYGITGCGFMWQGSMFKEYNEITKECTDVEITGEQATPRFQSGACGLGISSVGDWIHAAGSIRVGMCDSKFDGSVWVLKANSDELRWEKLGLEIPEDLGSVLIDSKNGLIYAVGDKVYVASI